METIIKAYTDDISQIKALKAFMKALNIKFEVSEQKTLLTPEWHLAEVEKRLSAYKQNPQQTETWEDIEKELERL
jgi:hypothetical protein